MDYNEFIEKLRLLLGNPHLTIPRGGRGGNVSVTANEMKTMNKKYSSFLKKLAKGFPAHIGPYEKPLKEGWYLYPSRMIPKGFPLLHYFHYNGLEPKWENLSTYVFNPYTLRFPRRDYIWINSYMVMREGSDWEEELRYLGVKLPFVEGGGQYLNWINENPFEVKQ